MLNPVFCRRRQEKFRAILAGQRLDAAVVTDIRDIYYFTGKLFTSHFGQPACLWLATAGGGWVVGPTSEGVHGVDEAVAYSTNVHSTMNLDWTTAMAEQAGRKLDGIKAGTRVGFQAESLPRTLGEAIDAKARPAEWVKIDSLLLDMQRFKYEDELAVMRESIRCDHAAYDAVQKVIRPGVIELEVLAAGYRGAQDAAGEKVVHDGDYQCGSMGGFARNKPLDAADMYVIDAWTFYRGYWSDLCRTFSVSNKPTELQQSVYDHVVAAHRKITPMFKPGTRGTEIAKATQAWMREHPALRDTSMAHHAGHGVGIHVHMEPDLNLQREGILREGDVVCYEPAAYIPDQRVFVRLENSYRITKDGPLNLVEYPFNLVR